jgi:hypothetical protein
MKVVIVSTFEALPVGHGGNHRSYQIKHDLVQMLGSNNVYAISWLKWHQTRSRNQNNERFVPMRSRPRRLISRIAQTGRGLAGIWHHFIKSTSILRWRHNLSYLFVEHPLDRLIDSGPSTNRFWDPAFAEQYERLLQEIEEPVICIIEHVGFSFLLPINERYKVQTIACTHNLESFDIVAPLRYDELRSLYESAIDLADELRILGACQERLFISRVEVGLVGGLGWPSHYYPYLPVGNIKENLEHIYQARVEGGVEYGEFLMIGSAAHQSTGKSFSWFVRQARRNGLPRDIRIVVVGLQTEKLSDSEIPGMEFRGWVEQDELDDLLKRATAVLIPQTSGFGALTRLSELSFAGIPMIVSEHPNFAVDSPPGITIVGDDWQSWRKQMSKLAKVITVTSRNDYETWAQRQVSPLPKILTHI